MRRGIAEKMRVSVRRALQADQTTYDDNPLVACAWAQDIENEANLEDSAYIVD
jgi:hypothetical protein